MATCVIGVTVDRLQLRSNVRILDRYVVREMLLPFFLGLVVLTFLLQMPPMLDYGEQLIAKGVLVADGGPCAADADSAGAGADHPDVAAARHPGRRSAACRPIASSSPCRPAASACSGWSGRSCWLAVLAHAGDAYVMIVAIPDANQTFREITFGFMASAPRATSSRACSSRSSPNSVLYVRDVPPTRRVARRLHGRHLDARSDRSSIWPSGAALVVDRDKQTVELVLEDGSSHSTSLKDPELPPGRDVRPADHLAGRRLRLPPLDLLKGDNEMSIAELRAKDAEAAKAGAPSYGQYFIQLKYSIRPPVSSWRWSA